MPGTLFVVSTPIGNLDDITLRALETLKAVALIAAEDTRRTATLLHHFGISTPSTSFHAHNEREKLPFLLEKLNTGLDIALVTDAGTPLVADPGQRLVAAAIESGVRIVPIPGASAVLSALAASGFPGDAFVFAGFAPNRSNDRNRWLKTFVEERRPVIFFEAPHRIAKTLLAIGEIFGERPIMVAREITKLHEQLVHTTAVQVVRAAIPEKGEFTIILGPIAETVAPTVAVDESAVRDYFGHMTSEAADSRRAAAAATAQKFGLSTNSVYAIIERGKLPAS